MQATVDRISGLAELKENERSLVIMKRGINRCASSEYSLWLNSLGIYIVYIWFSGSVS